MRAHEPQRRPGNVPAARQLRQSPTRSEALLWEQLRNRRFNGVKFRRQHPVGPFVLDFYCEELNVAIEVDGEVHDAPAQTRYDAARQSLIERDGIRFIRVRAEDVEADIAAVLQFLRRALSPQPALPEGEGESGKYSAT